MDEIRILARRKFFQALAAANDLVRAYNLLDIKLNRTLLDNIMILGLRHAVDPFQENQPVSWELP